MDIWELFPRLMITSPNKGMRQDAVDAPLALIPLRLVIKANWRVGRMAL